ncbi:DUF294 nucleotidyltransferase-like domain-containing protein [Rummeliibacillus sp. NPDC094406]|uniref:DUF294 nucleotidyltransferase-like domain-containing protein n=1 Tax=Rummeliibacillus sp. NPDC094406 TaxID=3364511 RepID=UPI00381D1F3A
MNAGVLTYETIKDWKDQTIFQFKDDLKGLNSFHDQVMRKVMQVAIIKLNKGVPPCNFSWFVTGSGGRLEQGFISDQDHGIIYKEDTEESSSYFKALGEELSDGLAIVGYPYCKGNIMSSNPLWCKSIDAWRKQLLTWMESESWEAIRYLQIFFDARVLEGKVNYIRRLKSVIYEYQRTNPNLLKRFTANIMHVKNVIGPFGQLLVERYGIYQGYLDIKYSAFVPYVNATRVLAIKEGVYETSTLARMYRLIEKEEYAELLRNCERDFDQLLKYRLSLNKVDCYSDTHFFKIARLGRKEKKEIKQIVKNGIRLHDEIIELIEKGC